MTLLLLLVLATASPSDPPDPIVGRLARLAAELDLAVHAADPLDICTDADLQVERRSGGLAPTEPTARSERSERSLEAGLDGVPLASLLAAALAELGLPDVPPCPMTDGDDAVKNKAARDAGAEWRLVVRPDDEGLSLELHAVDRGLWGPRDLAPVVAFAKETPEAKTLPADPTPRPEPGVTLVRAIATERTVRALAACDLNNDGTRELIGVTDDRVLVWREIRGVLAPAAEWAFGDMPRAAARVRAPLAGCVCGPFGPGGAVRLAIGHSDHERGVVLAARAEGTGLRLERERTLGTIPLGQLGSAIIGASPDQGRNRLGPAVTLSRAGDDRTFELARPILEIASAPGALKAYALDSEYKVYALTDAPALGSALASSGAGIALVTGLDGTLLLATTARTMGATDSLRLIDTASGTTKIGPIAITGAIVATASSRAGELWIATRPDGAARTVILRLSMGEVRR